MSEQPRVSIIIPVWNLWAMTSDCLRSVAEHTFGEAIEVVVADNASTDATAQELEPLGRSLFGSAFRTVRMPENLGFSKACNAGARAAASDLLFFLNNDTTVTPGWLPPLRSALSDKNTGAVGPLLLYPNDTVQHCGVHVTPFGHVGHLYEGLPASFAPARRPHPLQAITGAAIMVRKNEFSACGGFYEGYRNGFEDLDLCFSLRAMGLKVKVESSSVIHHHTSQTPGRFTYEDANSRLFDSRFGTVIRPDEHVLAALDGYTLHINHKLVSWLSLPEEKDRQWNAEFGGAAFDQSACSARLMQEPLWSGGWLLLAEHAEKLGQMQEALDLLNKHNCLFPETKSLAALLSFSRRRGFQNIAAAVEKEMKQKDSIGYKRVVREARRKAYANGDTALSNLFDNWLLRYATA